MEIVGKEFDVKGENTIKKQIRKQMIEQQEANVDAAVVHEAARKAGAPGYHDLDTDWKKFNKDRGQKKTKKAAVAKDDKK